LWRWSDSAPLDPGVAIVTQLEYRPADSALFHPRPRALDPGRLAIAMPVAFAVQVAASYFYIWFYHEYNDLFARLAACAGLAIGVWFLCGLVCEFGEVGDARVAAVVSLLIALFGLYWSWLFWTQRTLTMITGRDVPWWAILIHPAPAAQLVWHLHSVGIWKYHDIEFRGPLLVIVWIVEAAILVAAPVYFTTAMVTRRTPMCLNCHKRTHRYGPLLRFSDRDTDGFTNSVLNRRFDELVSFAPDARERDDYRSSRILLKLYQCPRCKETNLLLAEHVTFVRGNKGSSKRKETPIVEFMVIGAEQAEQLSALEDRLSPELEEPPVNEQDQPADDVAAARDEQVSSRDSDAPPSIGL
jgi:hypothetical protein